MLRKLLEVSEAYYECARNHQALAEAVAPKAQEAVKLWWKLW